MATIIRRRKLGFTSVKEICNFSKEGIRWHRSDRPNPPEDTLYIRWGCTADVPSKKVLNTAKAIHEVNDKLNFRMKLDEFELCTPTITMDRHPPDDSGVIIKDEDMEYPLILRPRNHSRGRNLILINNRNELLVQGRRFPDGWYASELFDKVAEFRVAIVQGRAIWVAKKTPGNPDDIAWNVAKGGRFDNVRWDSWPLKVVKKSIEAFNLTELDFGGVDVMVDKDGNVSILEINSAPSLTSPYRQECMAKAFDYIIKHGKERIPLIKEKGGYSKFIHPAITNKAKL